MSNSVSRSIYKLKAIESLFRTILLFENRLLSIEKSERSYRVIKRRYLNFIFTYYPYEKYFTGIASSKIRSIKIKTELPGTPIQKLLAKILGLKPGLTLYSIYYKIKYEPIAIE